MMMERAKDQSGLNSQRSWAGEAGLSAANRIAATHRMMINLRAKGSTALWYTTGQLGGCPATNAKGVSVDQSSQLRISDELMDLIAAEPGNMTPSAA
jgi:hypothetical protein